MTRLAVNYRGKQTSSNSTALLAPRFHKKGPKMQSADVHNVSTGWKNKQNQLFIFLNNFLGVFMRFVKLREIFCAGRVFFSCKDWR